MTDSGEGQMVVDSKESKNLSFYDKGLFGVKMKQMNTSDLLKKKRMLKGNGCYGFIQLEERLD